jgi:hypothetical protein
MGGPAAEKLNLGKSGGWAQSGEMETQNADKQVSVQANFPVAREYTVQFLVTPPAIVPNQPLTIQADITWTTNGNQIVRRVSVGNGVSVQGTAEAVKVTIRDLTPVGGPKLPYTAGISVAPGGRASSALPPTLVDTTPHTVAAGANLLLSIPQNVGITSVYVAVFAVTAANVPVAVPENNLSVSQNHPTGPLKRYDPRLYEFVPMAPGATALQLFNDTAADFVTFFVTYGIDG